MTTHEAVLGGARWRLTLHEDGRWDVARRGGGAIIWDDVSSGNGAVAGLRASADDWESVAMDPHFPELAPLASVDVLRMLADVAERNGT